MYYPPFPDPETDKYASGPFTNWIDVAEILRHATANATARQRALASFSGTCIDETTPKIVAAARLRLALASELGIAPELQEVRPHLKMRLDILTNQLQIVVHPNNEEEANAWISHLRLSIRLQALERLQLHTGDIVETTDGEMAEISSIGREGRLFFKGGRGYGGWPDQVNIVARHTQNSLEAAGARRQAANSTSLRSNRSLWSMAKHQDLLDFLVDREVTLDDISELHDVIRTANDERLIQKHLEDNKHLLTALVGGSQRYCIPQKRLGGEYIPDFAIGDVDSFGVRWILIELETPKTDLYLKSGEELDEKARKGVNQVIHWRQWLMENLAYARKRRVDNGIGLYDISPNSEAIVLVGRRSRMPETKNVPRQEYRQKNNIHIHTYDWLLERLRGIVRHRGPSATNPFIFSPEYE